MITVRDLMKALEGLDPELSVNIIERSSDSYLDITGIYETGEMRWRRVEIDVARPTSEEK